MSSQYHGSVPIDRSDATSLVGIFCISVLTEISSDAYIIYKIYVHIANSDKAVYHEKRVSIGL